VRDEIGGHRSDPTGTSAPPIWATQKERMPDFADYEKNAAPREIPVILLDPVA
jgi:hypothetical protein